MRTALSFLIVVMFMTQLSAQTTIDSIDDLDGYLDNGIVTLTDDNQNGHDFEIQMDLVFGLAGNINADLVIDPGVEIYFNLDVNSYGDEDTPADANDDIHAYTITILADVTLTCGDAEGESVVIRPNPKYSDTEDNEYLWYGYPTTDQNDPNEVWAGGFIIHSAGNIIENTVLDHLLGGDCHINENDDTIWFSASRDDCFEISLASANASLTLDEMTILSNGFLTGVIIKANSCSVTIDEALITLAQDPRPWAPIPDPPPDPFVVRSRRILGGGDGIFIPDGIENCTITGTSSEISHNEKHGIILRGEGHSLKPVVALLLKT